MQDKAFGKPERRSQGFHLAVCFSQGSESRIDAVVGYYYFFLWDIEQADQIELGLRGDSYYAVGAAHGCGHRFAQEGSEFWFGVFGHNHERHVVYRYHIGPASVRRRHEIGRVHYVASPGKEVNRHGQAQTLPHREHLAYG